MEATQVKVWFRRMNIILINPNTTEAMTARMHAAVSPLVAEGVRLTAITADYGAPSIEGYYDEVFAVPPMIEVLKPMADQVDGVVVGCFDDTGVDALRCLLDVPVVGICQAAMQAAAVVANKFSIVTTLPVSVPALENLVLRYGFDRLCGRVRAADIPVLDLEENTEKASQLISAELERALADDGAEAIVLGCAGMVELSRSLTERYGVPVIEGVGAAVKLVEGLATLGISTSTRGGYARPRQKTYSGALTRYSPSI